MYIVHIIIMMITCTCSSLCQWRLPTPFPFEYNSIVALPSPLPSSEPGQGGALCYPETADKT